MTCVIGVRGADGTIAIGADSSAGGVYSFDTRKMFRLGGLTVGYTSSFRFGQIVRYYVKPPAHPKSMSVEEYLVTRFVPEMKLRLSENGFVSDTNIDEDLKSGLLLVACRDRLTRIHTNYQVEVHRSSVAAVGCGEEVACGSAMASMRAGVPIRQVVKDALKDAAALSPYVAGPFYTTIHKGEAA